MRLSALCCLVGNKNEREREKERDLLRGALFQLGKAFEHEEKGDPTPPPVNVVLK